MTIANRVVRTTATLTGGMGTATLPRASARRLRSAPPSIWAFVVIEAGYGIASGSMALLADAGHNLSDVLGPTDRLGRGDAG